MNPQISEEGAQLLEQGNLQTDKQRTRKRKQIIINNRFYSQRQPDTNDILKSICLVSIFALVALGVIFYVISQSTGQNVQKQQILTTQAQKQTLSSQKSPIDNKEINIAEKQQNIIENKNKIPIQQQDAFIIEVQQKPQPSSPSQVPQQQQQQPYQFTSTQQNPWLQSQKDSLIKDKYFFKVPVQKLLQLSSPDKFFGKSLTKQMSGMGLDQLEFSLNLLYVTHNVNFKGQVEIQMAPYENNRSQKQKWIKKLLQTQKKIYQQKYEISEYMNQQLPFCIVTPSYNNVQSKLYLRNLDSIFMQQYQNYHVVYIDDASPDKTGQFVQRYVQLRKIPKDKIKVIINQKNVFALENIFNAIHNHCQPGEIVMLIDGDDALVGRQVFSLYNAIYQRTQSAFVYSNYLHVMFNQKAIIGASSRPIPVQLLQRHGGIRSQRGFFTSHLLSFYVDLFKQIKKQDLTYKNGTFFKYAYDVAMCTPMLEMIGDRVFYLPEITYQYRYDTGQNDPGSGQLYVTSIIFQKPVYEQLKQLPFIDDRENYLKGIKSKIKS